jgi:hypothetical protein
MDVGVTDDSLNGIPYEESSTSSDDEEEADGEDGDVDRDLIRSSRKQRERPVSFSKMEDIKCRFVPQYEISVSFEITNQMHKLSKFILLQNSAYFRHLLCPFSTVHSAPVSFMQVPDDCLEAVIKNVHESYECRMYGRNS